MTGSNDDVVWVARFLQGEQAAFETLVRRYQGILFTRDATMPEPDGSPGRPVNGIYRAGSDHRKDGQAVGW